MAQGEGGTNGSLSVEFELKCGLKQGAIYSPCLFSIFFNFVTAWMKLECERKGLGLTLAFPFCHRH